MATATQTAPQTPSAPQITVLHRVASIPLVSDSLAAVHATLSGNTYLKHPYTTAYALSSAMMRASEPVQARLAPVIVRADGFANKAVDAVESRYPYPFHAPTEEIYGTLRQHSEHAYGVANKTIDNRVRTPAYGFAHGIDQSFTPVVDRFAYVVNAFNSNKANGTAATPNVPADTSSKDAFQYQRAYKLSMNLKDTIYVYTTDQIKQIQEHNVLVQRASTTAQSISNVLSSSYGAATTRVHQLSDTMLTELAHLQASAADLPSHAQASLGGLTERVGVVIGDVKGVLASDAPVADKLGRLRVAIEQQVQPLLAGATARVQGAVSAVRAKAEEVTKSSPKLNGTANGNGTAH